MKKKLSYREKLLELAYIYNVKEIKEYVKSKKNLTSGQLELILKKIKLQFQKILKLASLKKILVNRFRNLKITFLSTKRKKLKKKTDI